MRNLKFIHIMVLNIAAIVATSCGDMLDLAPIDNLSSTYKCNFLGADNKQ